MKGIIMKQYILMGFVIVLFVLFGCGKSKNSLIVGKWEATNPDNPKDKTFATFTADGKGISEIVKYTPDGTEDNKKSNFIWKIEKDSLIFNFLDSTGNIATNGRYANYVKSINETEMILNSASYKNDTKFLKVK